MKTLKNLGRSALDYVAYLWAEYPARCISVVTAVVVYVASTRGIVLNEQDVTGAVKEVLPILLAGQLTHRRVTPA